MSPPVLVVLEESHDSLERIEGQLAQRYARDYRIEFRSDPEEALGLLTEPADAGSQVALVLVGKTLATASDGAPLDQSRKLHPRDRHGSVKRVASAVGEGSIAAELVHTLFASDDATAVGAG